MTKVPTPRRPNLLPTIVAWAVLLTYLVAARFVGSFFPLSIFDMYSHHIEGSVARVVALDASGSLCELSQFESFHCPEDAPRLMEAVSSCGPDFNPIEYVVRDQDRHISDHVSPVPGEEPIDVIVRSYHPRSTEGRPEGSDCVLMRCTGTRRR